MSPDAPPPDNLTPPQYEVFTGERCRHAWRLMKFLVGMNEAHNRDAYRADPEPHMRAFALTEQERELVRQRDWTGMIAYGATIYAIGKAGGALGATLVDMGVKMRGQTHEQFLQTRPFRQPRRSA